MSLCVIIVRSGSMIGYRFHYFCVWRLLAWLGCKIMRAKIPVGCAVG